MSTTNVGLKGVVAAETSIGKVIGDEGKLWYRGYSIENLTKNATYEEVAYLLLYGKLPNKNQLDGIINKIKPLLLLDDKVVTLLKSLSKDSDVMSVLRTAISFIGNHDDKAESEAVEDEINKSINILAKTTSIITAWHRIISGLEVVQPHPELNLAGNFLYMFGGEIPSNEYMVIFDKILILHAEHGLNASTFASRVITATLTDMYSSVVGAIGTLKGRLHGGANERVMDMLLKVGSPENAKQFVIDAFENKDRVMGMGHPVYKTTDPRAVILEDFAKTLFGENNKWLDIAYIIRDETRKIRDNLYPNVDFFSGSIYYEMGIPTNLYTPIFALARTVGWCAHIIEQRSNNQIIRPLGHYTGELDKEWIPIENRD
jgi:citrate synthase